jgi:hypothetical protein
MKLAETISRIRSAGVPNWFYVTGGELGAGECLGIEHATDGWAIYYSERGGKSRLESLPSEDAACDAFLRRLNRALRESGRGEVPLP